ncbi:hypothetical protein Glove_363g6 [Diversispora epigaea]|uniref:Cytochrome c oxidase subunit 8, mitochondrial n=1 Tax=Diversispora epigaea TaxID=1348612 RepID=A0A397H8T9_9GLOM|nr:hypothetical protein Glove_363g6 [Diversispora epigaea]
MYSSVFPRSVLLTRAIAKRPLLRSGSSYHWENVDGSHIPFSTKSKTGVAVRMTLYCGLGFAIPFIAMWWQFHKVGKPLYRPGPPPE